MEKAVGLEDYGRGDLEYSEGLATDGNSSRSHIDSARSCRPQAENLSQPQIISAQITAPVGLPNKTDRKRKMYWENGEKLKWEKMGEDHKWIAKQFERLRFKMTEHARWLRSTRPGIVLPPDPNEKIYREAKIISEEISKSVRSFLFIAKARRRAPVATSPEPHLPTSPTYLGRGSSETNLDLDSWEFIFKKVFEGNLKILKQLIHIIIDFKKLRGNRESAEWGNIDGNKIFLQRILFQLADYLCKYELVSPEASRLFYECEDTVMIAVMNTIWMFHKTCYLRGYFSYKMGKIIYSGNHWFSYHLRSIISGPHARLFSYHLIRNLFQSHHGRGGNFERFLMGDLFKRNELFEKLEDYLKNFHRLNEESRKNSLGEMADLQALINCFENPEFIVPTDSWIRTADFVFLFKILEFVEETYAEILPQFLPQSEFFQKKFDLVKYTLELSQLNYVLNSYLFHLKNEDSKFQYIFFPDAYKYRFAPFRYKDNENISSLEQLELALKDFESLFFQVQNLHDEAISNPAMSNWYKLIFKELNYPMKTPEKDELEKVKTGFLRTPILNRNKGFFNRLLYLFQS